jgi:hypothetical protein
MSQKIDEGLPENPDSVPPQPPRRWERWIEIPLFGMVRTLSAATIFFEKWLPYFIAPVYILMETVGQFDVVLIRIFRFFRFLIWQAWLTISLKRFRRTTDDDFEYDLEDDSVSVGRPIESFSVFWEEFWNSRRFRTPALLRLIVFGLMILIVVGVSLSPSKNSTIKKYRDGLEHALNHNDAVQAELCFYKLNQLGVATDHYDWQRLEQASASPADPDMK